MERDLAKRGRGQRVPGSGSGAEKADIRKYNKLFRVEAKTTKNRSFSVTREMVSKLEEVALSHGELPAFVIEFIDERGRPVQRLAVITLDALDQLNVDI
jgi:Holliday junction resolvase